MKPLTILLSLALAAAAQSTGDYTFTRKAATGYTPVILTPVSGGVIQWNGSGLPTNLTLGSLATLSAAPAGTLTGSTLASGVTASSLTSVGTITTGTWNGTTIAVANGGTGGTTAATGLAGLGGLGLTGGQTIQSSGAAVVPLTLQGASAQTANLQTWLDSSSSVKASISATGVAFFGGPVYIGEAVMPGGVNAGVGAKKSFAGIVGGAFQNDLASGYEGFNFHNNGGTLVTSLAHSNSGASFLPSSTWFGSRNSELVHIVVNSAVALTITSNGIRIPTAQTPASATATGTTGTVCWDTSYIYVCTATNTWKRAALATW